MNTPAYDYLYRIEKFQPVICDKIQSVIHDKALCGMRYAICDSNKQEEFGQSGTGAPSGKGLKKEMRDVL